MMPEDHDEIMVLSARAQKKWDQLDVDGSDTLEGEEVMVLAEWVWCSFRPGHQINSEQRIAEARKMLHRCDADENEKIDKAEFQKYYEQVSVAMFNFHKSRDHPSRESEELHQEVEKEVIVKLTSSIKPTSASKPSVSVDRQKMQMVDSNDSLDISTEMNSVTEVTQVPALNLESATLDDPDPPSAAELYKAYAKDAKSGGRASSVEQEEEQTKVLLENAKQNVKEAALTQVQSAADLYKIYAKDASDHGRAAGVDHESDDEQGSNVQEKSAAELYKAYARDTTSHGRSKDVGHIGDMEHR